MDSKAVDFFSTSDRNNYPLEKIPNDIYLRLKPIIKIIWVLIELIKFVTVGVFNLLLFWIKKGKLLKVRVKGKLFWKIINKKVETEAVSFYLEAYQYAMDRETFYRFALNNAPPYCVITFVFKKVFIPIMKIENNYMLTYFCNSKGILKGNKLKDEVIRAEQWFIDHKFKKQDGGRFTDVCTYMMEIKNNKDAIVCYTDSTMLIGQFVKYMADDFYKEKEFISLDIRLRGDEQSYDQWVETTFSRFVLDLFKGNY